MSTYTIQVHILMIVEKNPYKFSNKSYSHVILMGAESGTTNISCTAVLTLKEWNSLVWLHGFPIKACLSIIDACP